MRIVKTPSAFHIAHLHEWLDAERRETGEGFFCNWEVICNAHDQGKLWIAEMDSTAVALVAWSKLGKHGGIDILTVEPSHRGKGVGRFLADAIIEHFRMSGVETIKIQSEPTSSEPFWLSLGFRENPDNLCERINGIPMRNLYLYKALC